MPEEIPPPQEPINPQPKGDVPLPRCKAILLAEKVIVDIADRRVSVIGIIERLTMPKFPSRSRPMHAFLLLTDGIGRYDIVVEMHDLKNDVVIGRGLGIAIQFPERLRKMNIVIPIPPIPLVHPGAYDFVVVANGREIDRQQFLAELPKGQSDEESSEQSGQ